MVVFLSAMSEIKTRKEEVGRKGVRRDRKGGLNCVKRERGWVTDVLQELKLFMKARFFFCI